MSSETHTVPHRPIDRDAIVAKWIKCEGQIDEAFKQRFLDKFAFFFLGLLAAVTTKNQMDIGTSSALRPTVGMIVTFVMTLCMSKSFRTAALATSRWATIYYAMNLTHHHCSPYLSLLTASPFGSRNIPRSLLDFLFLLFANLSVFLSTAYLNELCSIEWARSLGPIHPNSSTAVLE